jgi:predicted phage tail protein
MRTVRLNGALGKKYGRLHKLDVQTPAEAMRALFTNFPGLKQDLIDSAEKGIAYRCLVDKDTADEQRLLYPMSREFSITPVVVGAGKVFDIIAGIALIALAVFQPELIPTLVVNGTTLFSAATVAWMGIALTLGGIAQLLTPTPQTNQTQKQVNNVIDGPVNITAQGAAVPIGYGRVIVGSAVISAGITVQQPVTPTLPYDYNLNGYAIP